MAKNGSIYAIVEEFYTGETDASGRRTRYRDLVAYALTKEAAEAIRDFWKTREDVHDVFVEPVPASRIVSLFKGYIG